MQKSANLGNLATALNLFQSEVTKVGFDSKNPFLKNKYASLTAVIETSKPFLSKYGLSISQFPVSNPQGQVGVTTILMHVSGEFLEETCLMTPEKSKGVNDAQSAGIAITYCRRYGWSAVLGMTADEDTDAHVDIKEVAQQVKEAAKERVFSIDALEVVISAGVGATNHEEAMEILAASVLPEDSTVKTVSSWIKHFAGATGDTLIACADVANQAYIKAQKTQKAGK